MKRTIAIVDIHGGLKALKQVVERAAVSKNDVLIFLGDYVDGWSESVDTIDYLIELSVTHECVFIKGNHDAWCEDFLLEGKANETWLLHGGASTYDKYEDIQMEKRKRHIDFFKKMKLYYVDTENRLFIHAGFTSMKGPEQEFYQTNFYWDRTLAQVLS